MLPRANRVITADEFRSVVRRGRKTAIGTSVYYRLSTHESAPARFGFVISRAVGPAVVRNRLRRRLRAIAFELVRSGCRGVDIVIRPLPGAASAVWSDLHDEVLAALGPRRASA